MRKYASKMFDLAGDIHFLGMVDKPNISQLREMCRTMILYAGAAAALLTQEENKMAGTHDPHPLYAEGLGQPQSFMDHLKASYTRDRGGDEATAMVVALALSYLAVVNHDPSQAPSEAMAKAERFAAPLVEKIVELSMLDQNGGGDATG